MKEENSQWLLKGAYSWGEEEPDESYPSEDEAVGAMKRSAVDELITASGEHPGEVTLTSEDDGKAMVVNYLYDDTCLRYSVCRA